MFSDAALDAFIFLLSTMEKVVALVFLSAVVGVFGKPVQEDSGECAVFGSGRKECGWLGIDEQTCLKRGCCWDTSDSNAKYCFVKKGKYLENGQCPVAPSERQECGYYGITREQCLNKTCCWDDSVQNAKWCFQQPTLPPAYCYIYHGISGVCSYTCRKDKRMGYGIFSCGGRICCYSGYGE